MFLFTGLRLTYGDLLPNGYALRGSGTVKGEVGCPIKTVDLVSALKFLGLS